VAPIKHDDVKAYDKNIRYVPPPIYNDGKSINPNFDEILYSQGVRDNPYMHQDPYGYLNKSEYPEQSLAQQERMVENMSNSHSNMGNHSQLNRLSIGRISKRNPEDFANEYQQQQRNVSHQSRYGGTKSRLFERVSGENVLDQQTMDYHYVKHHELNARGEPVLKENDTHKLRIN